MLHAVVSNCLGQSNDPIVVRNHYDVPDTDDNYPNSLRWAIDKANSDPGEDIIVFNIQTTEVPCEIELFSLLIPYSDLTIDATTQPNYGYEGIEPRILINAEFVEPIESVFHIVGTSNITIRGFTIVGSPCFAIWLYRSNNIVIDQNVFYDDGKECGGEILRGQSSDSVVITRNYFGVNRSFTKFSQLHQSNCNNFFGNNWTVGGDVYNGDFLGNTFYKIGFGVYGNLAGEGINNYYAGNRFSFGHFLHDGANYNYPSPNITSIDMRTNTIYGTSQVGDRVEVFQGVSGGQTEPGGEPLGMAQLVGTNWSIQVPQTKHNAWIYASATNQDNCTSEVDGYFLPELLIFYHQGCSESPIDFEVNFGYNYFQENITAVKWNFGDGSPIEFGRAATHTYMNNTLYKIVFSISLEVTLNTGSVLIEEFPIDVYPTPQIFFTPASVREGQDVHFSSVTNVAVQSWQLYYYGISGEQVIIASSTVPILEGTVMEVDYAFEEAGDGEIEIYLDYDYGDVVCTGEGVVKVCSGDCIYPFAPKPGESYVISAWVSEDFFPTPQVTFTSPVIQISFLLSDETTSDIFSYTAKGPIIEGWQKIEETFLVPEDAIDITVSLLNANWEVDSYFDDIRIFPVNGSIKTYVYDPENLRFVAELDENNYATFYEYDQEGKLNRLKKETERGIVTLKESRSNMSKLKIE